MKRIGRGRGLPIAPTVVVAFVFLLCQTIFLTQLAIRNDSKKNVGVSQHQVQVISDFNSGIPISDNLTDVVLHPQGRRSYAVIHVGPPKTGTTTIQGFLAEQYETLLLDKYWFIGKVNFEDLEDYIGPTHNDLDLWRLYMANCLLSTKAKRCEESKFRLTSIFSVLLKNGYSVIVSAEEMISLSDDAIATLSELFKDFEVKIVVGYRRYYELMKSLYSEMYRRASHRRGLRKWPNEAGGIRIPTPEEFIFSTKKILDKYYQVSGERQDYVFNGKSHPSKDAYDAYKKYFIDVDMINIHDETHLLENFACNIIIGANNFCEESKDSDVSEGLYDLHYGDRFKLDYEMIVQYINDKHGHQLNITRQSLYMHVLMNHQILSGCPFEIGADVPTYSPDYYESCTHLRMFPQICTTYERWQQILSMTADFERQIVPNYHEQVGKNILDVSNADELHGLCWIDTHRLFNDDAEWKKFESLIPNLLEWDAFFDLYKRNTDVSNFLTSRIRSN